MTRPWIDPINALAAFALLLAVCLAPVETVIGAGLGAWMVTIRFVAASDGRGL